LWLLWFVAGLGSNNVELPVYPGAPQVQIGDDLIVGGAHFRIAYFSTPDSVQAVADHFLQYWRGQGYPTAVDGDGGREITVSAFLTRQGVQRSVVLRRDAQKTIGFAALHDLWWNSSAVEPASVEGALFAQNLETHDDHGRTRNISALLESSLTDAENQSRRDLERQGFVLGKARSSMQQGKRAIRLEHLRGEERIVTALIDVGEGLTASSQMRFSPAPVKTEQGFRR
jgi:hypothetical protein